MAGLWTKHFSVDQRTYYYNAAQGRSVWEPPPEANVHAAINLRAPTYLELAKSSNLALHQPQLAQLPQPLIPLQPSQTQSHRPVPFISAEDLLAHALQQERQKQLLSRKEDEVAPTIASSSTAVASAYLLQKSELEALAGGKCDTADGSKWHVR